MRVKIADFLLEGEKISGGTEPPTLPPWLRVLLKHDEYYHKEKNNRKIQKQKHLCLEGKDM